jgi:hypothetical protein
MSRMSRMSQSERTFNKLSAVCLSRSDFNGDLVTLWHGESAATGLVSTKQACEAGCEVTYGGLVEELDGDADCGGHVCGIVGA